MKPGAVFAALAALGLAGCASTADQRPAPAPVENAAFAPVQHDVASLSGQRVVWNQDIDTGKLVTDEAWKRLQRPLDANAAAQIALFNNPGLQATFDEMAEPEARAPGSADAPRSPAARQALVTHQVIELIAETKETFYAYQGDLQLDARFKLMLAGDNAQAGLAQKQQQAGGPDELAVLDAPAQAAAVQVAINDAHKQRIADREKLCRLMGLSMAAIVWTAKPELPPLPDHDPGTAELEFIALDQRRDLKALREEIDAVATPLARRQLQRRLQSLAIEIGSQVREAGRTMFVDRQQVELFKKTVVPLATAAVDQTLAQSDGKQFDANALFLAEQRELEAERGYVDAWRDYWIARARLEAAAGGNLYPKNAPP